MKRFRSAGELLRELTRLQGDVDIISFDVFDTLLMRDVAPPDQTKVPAAKWLVDRAAELGRKVSIAEALQSRDAVEAILRKQTEAAGGDHECHLDRLAVAWAERVLGQASCDGVAQALVRVELAGELAVCHAIPGMFDVVKHARSLGKKVLLLSDMYLGRAHIRQLLDHTGFRDCYHELYVSSELGVSKWTGRMFLHIAKEQQVRIGRWVHIGDNVSSDVRSPKRLGMRALWFGHVESEKKLGEASRCRRLGKVHPSWYGAQYAQWCCPASEARVRDVSYTIGFSVLGPLLTSFLHLVLERVKQHNVRLVLFPAREGFVLGRLFRMLKPVVAPDTVVHSEYAYLTRKVTYLASMDHIGFRELAMGLWTRVPTLQTMLSRFSLDSEDFRDVATECGLAIDERLQAMGDPRLLHFVRHPAVLKRLRQAQKVKRDQLHRYLQQVGFWECERAAFVDLGWNGTTQDALTWAFMGEIRWPRLFGWYLGFRPYFARVKTPTSTYEGLIYERDRHGQVRSAVCRYLEIFELATRAPHATAVDLAQDPETGEICPVLKHESSASRQAELRDQKTATSMQAGIFDFAEAYGRTVRFQDHGVDAFCDYACEVADLLLRYPSVEVGRAMSEFFHGEDFGTDIVMQHKRMSPRFWNPGDWLRLYRNRSEMLWSEGVVAGAGVPTLLGLYNLYRAGRERHY